MESAVGSLTRGMRGAGGKGTETRGGRVRILSQGTQPVRGEIGVELPLGPSAHALRSPRGSPPTPKKLGPDFPRFSRGYEMRDGDRRFGGSPPPNPKRTYTGLRASGDPTHSGTLTAKTTSARAANPLLRSPNGRSTPVKPHAPERAPPSSASLSCSACRWPIESLGAWLPRLFFFLQLTNGHSGRSRVPPPLLCPGLWAGGSLRRRCRTGTSLCA